MTETPVRPGEVEDTLVVEDTFSVASLLGDTHAVLEQLRTRLLDLTLMNRLLNFKHGARTVRVIDELPDQLFDRLRNGDELEFIAVPEPTKEREASAEKRKEREAAARASALAQGLAVSYDLPTLPIDGSETPGRHTDKAIQTLLFPPDLERALRGIASDARSAIEEKGSNILHLIFGFLEWDDHDRDKRIISPLLMVPATLRRGEPDRKTGAYRFFISYSGEDLLANISLQEKLRRDYNLVIPDVAEDDTPDTYTRRIIETVPLPSGWSVRRQVTLGLLQFTKLLMYRDLDPAQWPKGASLVEHPRLLELFHGGNGGGEEYAKEYDFEANGGPTPASVPPVVMDADSSQHSAIVDAMAGRSMVIEGPPGTGKSQTIANLIAAALGEGKTVLFVADKLTALEVVRKRLDGVGLGLFCLELHSDKTQKTLLMDDLRKRVAAQETFQTPDRLEECARVVRRTRDSLNSYSKLLNTRIGALGWTAHEILWGAERRRTILGAEEAKGWGGVQLDTAHELRLADYEELCRAAATFGTALQHLRSQGDLAQHVFWGAWLPTFTPDTEERVLRSLATLDEAVTLALTHLSTAQSTIGAPVPQTLDELREWSKALGTVRASASGAFLDAAARLGTAAEREALASWCQAVERHVEQERALVSGAASVDVRDTLRGLDPAAFERFRPDTPLRLLASLEALAADAATWLPQATTAVAKLGRLLGDPALPPTLESLELCIALVELAASAPFDSLSFRPRGDEGIEPTLAAVTGRIEELRAERSKLGGSFALELLSAEEVIERYAATCATAGFFSFLSADYRAAKRQYVLLTGGARRAQATQMAADYQALLSHVKRVAQLEGNKDARTLLGAAFRGLETNLDAVRTSRSWQAQVHALQRRYRSVTKRVAAIAGAAPADIQDLADLRPVLMGWRARELVGALRAIVAAHGRPPDARSDGLEDLAHFMAAAAEAVAPLSAVGRRLGASVSTFGDLGRLAALAREVASTAERLEVTPAPREALGRSYQGLATPLAGVYATLQYAAVLFSTPTPDPLRRYLCRAVSHSALPGVTDLLEKCEAAVAKVHRSEADFCSVASVSRVHWYGTDVTTPPFPMIATRAARAAAQRHALSGWVTFLRARTTLRRYGLDKIRELAESRDDVRLGSLQQAVEFVVYESLARHIFATLPGLAEHDAASHSATREAFRTYDIETIKLEPARLAHRIASRPVPEGNNRAAVKSRTDLALLRHELDKQRRHLPIRQLVSRSGRALRALKPCFMMSPRSVAQYLEPGLEPFDLVVMDEASQLRPEDAVGVIARARQVIVVGDSRQLPPTSFFTSGGDEEKEEEYVTENKESILDLARTMYRPVRELRWHYRSRHGSLIAFSNARYYDNKLIVFPGPSERSVDLGVSLELVEGALYADGLNQREAERVTDAVLEHLRTRPGETFGVVALNVRQKALIEALVHQRLKNEPELRGRFDRPGETDGAFIKNLESVQGDERDVIYISVTYGPSTPGGRVARRFGPLNGTSGWRRLNVLFTRAKRRVVVFASFRPEQVMEATGEPSRGARDLCDYLAFARTGRYQRSDATEREPDSDFEVEVANALRNEGYSVTPQVGVAGYFIDLGVRSSPTSRNFVLGVECDGATYHSSFSARDRDRLRQQVLEGLGWKIHRIWSTAWFRDPRTETARLVRAVREAEAAPP